MSDSRDARLDTEERRASGPRPGDLAAALALLTALPLRRIDPRSPACGRATLFFPVVGFCMGSILLGLNRLIGTHPPQWMIAAVLVGVWEVLGKGETLRAWRRVGDWSVDSVRTSPAGAAVMAAVALTKILGLTVQGGARPAAVLFAPMLARWAMVVLATGARDAGMPARKFNPAITFREFALTSVVTFAAVLTLGEAFGVVLVVAVAALTLALRLLSHGRAGGVSWRLLQAGAASVETFVVVLCTWLVKSP